MRGILFSDAGQMSATFLLCTYSFANVCLVCTHLLSNKHFYPPRIAFSWLLFEASERRCINQSQQIHKAYLHIGTTHNRCEECSFSAASGERKRPVRLGTYEGHGGAGAFVCASGSRVCHDRGRTRFGVRDGAPIKAHAIWRWPLGSCMCVYTHDLFILFLRKCTFVNARSLGEDLTLTWPGGWSRQTACQGLPLRVGPKLEASKNFPKSNEIFILSEPFRFLLIFNENFASSRKNFEKLLYFREYLAQNNKKLRIMHLEAAGGGGEPPRLANLSKTYTKYQRKPGIFRKVS